RYARQVSRAVAVDPGTGAYTAGAGGVVYRYDFRAQKLEKLDLKLPATPGRESWASLDAAVVYPKHTEGGETFTVMLGGTSDGHPLELRIYENNKFQLRPRGRPLGQTGIQGQVLGSRPQDPAEKGKGSSGGTGCGKGGGTAGRTAY